MDRLPARSCAIDLAAKRALPAMLCHRQVGRLDLVRDLSAAQRTEEFVHFGATIGLDELSCEMVKMWTIR